MKYEFVHKRNSDWCFEELRIINETFALVNDPEQENLVYAIGQHLAAITQVKALVIGRILLPAAEKVRTIYFFNQGKVLPNFTYSLQYSPCHRNCEYNVCYHPFGVREEFPFDKTLIKTEANSYMGTTFTDQDGNKTGLIALLHDSAIQNPGFIEHLITIVSPMLEQKLAALVEETV